MDDNHFEADLTCSGCGRLGAHELVYTGRLLARTRCLACGRVEHHEPATLRGDYLEDLQQRLISKPARMARRFRRNPVGYPLSIPVALARKPIRMLREVTEVLRGR